MALLDQYNLSQSAAFQHRVEQALLERCGVLLADNATPSGLLALARSIVYDIAAFTPIFTAGLATHNTIAASAAAELATPGTISDATLQGAVDTVLPFYVR